ncbi:MULTISPECIES: DEAD/DEAH box helicase family protein [Pirellulaceae]|nr:MULTISPECIES: DEAD/DEAH box helicase family protein [Pirellulaceae]
MSSTTSKDKSRHGVVEGVHHTVKRRLVRGKECATADILLRPSQLEAYAALKQSDYGILNAPTGWGKSAVLCTLAGDDLLTNPERKVVFCIPQRVIAKGFVGETRIEVPGHGKLNWKVDHDLCGDSTNKIQQIHRFLLEPAMASVSGRILVTTHQGLAIAFGKLPPDQFVEAIFNTTFVIDEAHHVQAAERTGNQLGELVTKIVDCDEPSTRILLTTAYFFRGDKLPILQDRQFELFQRHLVPFDDHWRNLKYLSSYRYDFVAFKGTVWKSLDGLLSESQEPTIIYCPQEGHRLLLGSSKETFTKRVIDLIRRKFGATLWTPKWKPSRPIILDLVDTQNRAEKVKFAMEHGDKIAVILTVGMFREGADWRQAQRVIDLIPTGSDQDRNQRFGRLIRDHPEKQSVSYFSFFPQVTSHKDGKQREELTRLYAHFHASLVLENALAPINVMPKTQHKGTKKSEKERPTNLLGQFNEQTQEAIISDCHEALLQLHTEADSSGATVPYGDAREAMIQVLRRHGVTQNEEPLAKQVVLMLRRRVNLKLPVAELVKAGFDKVWSTEALDGIRLYSAGFGGPDSFDEIRRVILDVFNSQWLDMYQQIRKLVALPTPQHHAYWWIQNNKSFYRDGRLSEERVRLLEEIPWWEWQRTVRDRWNEQFKQLKGLENCPPAGTKEYDWVRHQRRMQEKNSLPAERKQKLESIPWWTWNNYSRQFDVRLAQLRRLRRFPKSRTPEYEFAKYFRRRKQQGKLEQERIKELEAIPWWSW